MLLPLSRRNIKAAMSRRKHQPPRNSRPAQHEARPHARNSGQRPEQPEKSGHHGHHRKPSSGSGPIWLYGTHACLAALANPERYCRRLVLTRETLAEIQPRLPAQPQPEIVDKSRLDALLPPQAVHQGIALQVEPLEDPGIESLTAPLGEDREIVVLLDQVTDPRNIGAVIRSAAAFGARAVVLPDRHSPEATGALAKAASGGLEVLPLIRVTNLARALDQLAEYGFWRVGLEMETDKTLAQAVSGIKRVALVLGAEDEGLRRLTREKCDFLAKLPMTGAVESLNVSAAAAVALYECARGG
ncbi:23S rRNA (guanosine(2251)-2'-O)-methyltransferase RlmB [Ferrovibrio sp.]|uniref:23S rRNA (guanosine(2251)-2'-O)-methyltransferase RlmB n=1 Tax=Ferrovibrio sp. TaxID=1917215 RepID=UPI003D0A98C4